MLTTRDHYNLVFWLADELNYDLEAQPDPYTGTTLLHTIGTLWTKPLDKNKFTFLTELLGRIKNFN